jgi:acyl-CoA hydrolase
VDARPASEPSAVLVKWMGITDANSAGFIHGGTVMKLSDEAAGLAAVRHSHSRVVTAAVDRMTFLDPVFVGDLLTLTARVNAVWRTSMEVGVRVDAENPRTGESRHTGSAYFTMVALDEDDQPTSVPDVQIEDEVQERRAREAQVRRANRLAERDELRAGRGQS